MKHYRKQTGSAHVAISIVLVIGLLAALGWIFWQNFVQEETVKKPQKVVLSETKDESPKKDNTALIDYKDGVVIKNETDLDKLEGAPDSFKAYIMTVIEKNSTTINAADGPLECKASVLVRKITKASYSEGMLTPGCSPNYIKVWGLVDGEWDELTSAHATWYMCKDLEKHKIPSAIVDEKCFSEDSNTDTIPYSQD